jgi:hypothetical protein
MLQFAHGFYTGRVSVFGQRRPKIKRAASPGGTFGILLPGRALSTGRRKLRFATHFRRKARF